MGTVAVDPGRACPARWIVLVAVDGLGTNDIARRTGVPMPMVILWRSGQSRAQPLGVTRNYCPHFNPPQLAL